ncbi:MAG TPA: CAP domain-containing protein [Anaeromyxobacteraceae bacterium]|nr:CAP domain-containing protein [Anaeromyxobacteraceae bacterium]
MRLTMALLSVAALACAGPAPLPAGETAAGPGLAAASGRAAASGPAIGPLPGTGALPPGAAAYGPEPSVSPTPLERAAYDAVRGALPPGAVKPVLSPALVLAARAVAARAAAGDPDPISRPRLREALSAGLSYDPAPVAVLLAASPHDAAAGLAARALSVAGQTHFGVGVAERGATAWVALLAARRLATLEPFPRQVEAGVRARLRGELRGLSSPRVFLTLPSGLVREVPVEGRRAFSAEIRFESRGRYLLEVLGTGASGPAVAALFAVSCGGASLAEPAQAAAPPDPSDLGEAEAQVLSAIDATRRRHGLSPLETGPELGAAARRHSQRMVEVGVLAHVLPGDGDVGERLRRDRIPFRRATENIALGPTALAAHAAAEESPGHRANLLDPRARLVGCGLARGRLPGGEPVVYLTEILVEPLESGPPSRLSPEGRVKQAIWRERERLGRPPLLQDAKLDELAREAVRSMLARDDPAPGDLGERALALGRGLAAVDAFVAAAPEGALRSANLGDARHRRVGVAAAVGDSSRYGPGLLWIAVVYTD